MKLPKDLLGITSFQQSAIEAAMRQQEMEDRLLGSGARELLDAYEKQKEMLERYARPELELLREYKDLHSGVSAMKAAEAAAGAMNEPAERALAMQRDIDRIVNYGRELSQLHDLTATNAITKEAERVANYGRELSHLHDFTAASAFMKDIERATSGYETLTSLAGKGMNLDHVWASYAGHGELERAMRVVTPWVDALDPYRSFEAFGVASQVGEIVKTMSMGGALGDLDSLMGAWMPPMDFHQWDLPKRLSAYDHAGVDMRIFDIPSFAYGDVAREVGITIDRPERPTTRKARRQRRRGASLNAAAGFHVKKVELMMRVQIARRAEEVHGPDWEMIVIPPKTLKRLKKVQADRTVGSSPAILDHSYFSDLVEISMQVQVWEALFGDLQIEAEEFEAAMKYCVAARNAVAHYLTIDQREFNMVCASAARLMAAFDPNDENATRH